MMQQMHCPASAFHTGRARPTTSRRMDGFVSGQHRACAGVNQVDQSAKSEGRLYRVRLTRMHDHPVLMMLGEEGSRVLIERIDGAKRVFAPFRYWEDTDAWASWRWREADLRGEVHSDFDLNMSCRLQMWALVQRNFQGER